MKKLLALIATIAVSACVIACSRQRPATEVATAEAADDQQDFKTLEDRFSYAYGADLGKKFKAEGIELNATLMAEAMQSVFDGVEGKMDAGEITATMDIYREVHLKKKDEQRTIAAQKNRIEGAQFLRTNAAKQGVTVTKSGLQYRVISEGAGGYTPSMDDEVKVHYRARFIDGTEFDSTHSRNAPYSVNAKMLIAGWAEALQLMSAGSRWELYVPADLAYGENGSDPYVGPNAVLIFDVELLEIERR